MVSEFIIDDDLRAKLDVEIKNIQLEHDRALLDTITTPRVDAFIKLLIAFKDIIIPMFRPIGSACMTGFFVYCTYYHIPLDNGLELILGGAFPAWMTSRHVHKSKSIETNQYDPDFD